MIIHLYILLLVIMILSKAVVGYYYTAAANELLLAFVWPMFCCRIFQIRLNLNSFLTAEHFQMFD